MSPVRVNFWAAPLGSSGIGRWGDGGSSWRHERCQPQGNPVDEIAANGGSGGRCSDHACCADGHSAAGGGSADGGQPGGDPGGAKAGDSDSGAPFYDVYRTADGGYMAVGTTDADLFAALLKTLGLDAAQLPDQHDRAGWPLPRERLRAAFATRSRAEWSAIFADVDAAVTPVLDPYEALDHPHHRASGTYVDGGGYEEPGPAPRFYDLEST